MLQEDTQRFNTIVIGGGQAGLVTGYYLRKRGVDFAILDASQRVGDAWRNRWDSLRLFTPAQFCNLPGMPYPGPRHEFPPKDKMADYLESYAERFDLPIQLETRVESLNEEDGKFVLTAGEERYVADNVVVAMGSYQAPRRPSFAHKLDPSITQMHAGDYRNPSQLQEGSVLVVGAGNSGAEIGLEVSRDHPTWLSGREVGHVPFRVDRPFGLHVGVPFVMRILFHRLITTDTAIGRKLRPKMLSQGGLLVRVKPQDLLDAGVERVPKTTGVESGLPVVGDDRVLDVNNVIWCTGFQPDFSWIELPIFNGVENPKEPEHERGIVPDAPGLYFVGLFFQYALSSSILVGVGRDAKYVVDHLSARNGDMPGS